MKCGAAIKVAGNTRKCSLPFPHRWKNHTTLDREYSWPNDEEPFPDNVVANICGYCWELLGDDFVIWSPITTNSIKVKVHRKCKDTLTINLFKEIYNGNS